MGDVMTLIEQAEKAFDAEQAAADAEKIMGGSFTLQDFLKQIEAMSKMGSMTKILGMLSGMGQIKEQLADFDDREVDKIKAIILSMTPAERAEPKMIDGSRRARISKGSGTQVSDVNQLVERFFAAQKMMQQMAKGGGMPGMPGMGGLPGVGPGKRAGADAKSSTERVIG
jgi:signal recognition particle subunit SRP54